MRRALVFIVVAILGVLSAAAGFAVGQGQPGTARIFAADPPPKKVPPEPDDHRVAPPPTVPISVQISPDGPGPYGVATTFTVKFSDAIPDASKAQAAGAFVVVGSTTLPPGAWVFISDTTMVYRTKDLLPAHSTVTVGHMPMTNGLVYKDSAGTHRVDGDPIVQVKIGRSMVTQVDAANHVAQVSVDGNVARQMGVSTGQPGYATRSGFKVTGEKYSTIRMTSASVGISDFYDLQVPYAVRLTDSGEFMHAAPWNGNIGSANTSHGCTNLTLDDGRWFYQQSIPGDPVLTVGTNRTMGTDDSNGGVWNYTWEQWQGKAAR